MNEPVSSAAVPTTEENDSLSPEARAALGRIRQYRQQLPQQSAGSAAATPGPMTAEAAQRARKWTGEMLQAATQSLLAALKVGVEDETIDGVPVRWLVPQQGLPKEEDARIAVYIHGGGYVAGETLDPLVVTLAHRTGLRILSIDYRLAPEHPFPAGRDDCLAVYRELLRRFGAHRLVVCGGSAGGGLALSALLAARDAGLPLPSALALLSPWSDLTRSGDSYYANEGRDPVLSWPELQRAAEAYAGDRDPRSPELSPIHADYRSGFPPTLITTGTRDLFLSNCVRLYRRLRQAGVVVDLQIWEGMWHSFEGLTASMPESAEAIEVIAGFLLEPSAG